MGQIRNSRIVRGLAAFVLAAAGLTGGMYSVLLFVQVFHGNGSTEGTSYLFTLALILLIFFPIALAFSIHYWKLCKTGSTSDATGTSPGND